MDIKALNNKQLLALMAMLTCCLPLFFIKIKGSLNEPIVRQALDAGHVFFFLLLTLPFYYLLKGKVVYKTLFILVSALIFSFAIELIQAEVGRSFQWSDIYRNMLGTTLGIFIITIRHQQSQIGFAASILGIVCVIAAVIVDRIEFVEALIARV